MGRGATSTVYKATNRLTDEFVALKVISKVENEKGGKRAPKTGVKIVSEKTLMEIHIHQQIDCPYIIKLHHAIEDEQHVILVLEYCDGTDIFTEIKSQKALKQQLKLEGAFEEGIAALYLR